MAKPRWMTLLAALLLLLTATSILSHFVADAVCGVTAVADGVVCADGRSDANSSVPDTSNLHSSFTLPLFFAPFALSPLTAILMAFTLVYLTYSLAPSPPPPRPLS